MPQSSAMQKSNHNQHIFHHPLLEISISARCNAIQFLSEQIALGDTFALVVKILQKFYHAVGSCQVAILAWATITLTLPAQHITLVFDYQTQRLKQILLHQVQQLVLSYRQQTFSSPKQSQPPLLREIDAVFGATRPGQIAKPGEPAYEKATLNSAVDSESQHKGPLYVLSYPGGLDFTFPLPENSSKIHNDLVCSKISIACIPSADGDGVPITNSSKAAIPEITLSTRSNFALENVTIYSGVPNRYSFHFSLLYYNGERELRIQRVVRFNDSCQNVQSELGAPDDVFYRTEQKSAATSLTALPSSGTDYFYNYFKLGMDLMFDGNTKRLRKVVLHTCRPEHQDFGKRYSPCLFQFSGDDRNDESKISHRSTFADIKPLLTDVGTPILLSRQNTCDRILEELSQITGANLQSGYVYHAKDHSEIYEITANGELSVLTIY